MSTHHKCREILAELGKEGSLIYLDMPFPQQVKRQYKLADFLEDEVDEKYYLSEKMLNCFQVHKDRHDGKGNGFGMIPKTRESEVANAIGTKAGTRATDNCIKEGLIQVGNIDTKGHNSLWGRVYDTDGIAPTQNAHGGGAGAKTGLFKVKGKVNWFVYPHGANKGGFRLLDTAPTITTSSWEHNNFIERKERIRKLTPREAARVQGDFEDMYKFDGFSDTKKYEFIGNAIEINTMRHLIKRVLDFSKDLEWNETQEPTFKQSAKVEQLDLFGEIA